MFINIVGWIDEVSPKRRERIRRATEEHNKQEYIKYLKAQAMLDGTYIDS